MLSGMPWRGSVWGNDDHRFVFLGTDAVLVYILVGLVSQNKAIKSNFTQRHKLWIQSLEFAQLSPSQRKPPISELRWMTRLGKCEPQMPGQKCIMGERCPFSPALEEQWRSQRYNGADLRNSLYLSNFQRFTPWIYRGCAQGPTFNILEKWWQTSSMRAVWLKMVEFMRPIYFLCIGEHVSVFH